MGYIIIKIYNRINKMGNICNQGSHEKQQTTQTVDTFNKNFPICEFTIKNNCRLSLILGTHRYHRSQTLLIITQNDYLEYCPELREYAQNYTSTIDQVVNQRRKLLYVPVSRNCPYKKLQLCILPVYSSNQMQLYLQQFQSIIQEVLLQNSDITLQLAYTAQNLNGLPNQTLMSVFLKFISANVSKPIRISIISGEVKLLNMVRYEVVKLENYTVNMYNVDIHA